MMAINLDVWPPLHAADIQFRLIKHAYADLFTARANECKWNSGDVAMKSE
jgi:hypothetical protein